MFLSPCNPLFSNIPSHGYCSVCEYSLYKRPYSIKKEIKLGISQQVYKFYFSYLLCVEKPTNPCVCLLKKYYDPSSSAIFASTSFPTLFSITEDRSSFVLSAFSFISVPGVLPLLIIPFAFKTASSTSRPDK